MKGVNFLTDETNKQVAVQIDLKLLEKYDTAIEDLLDGILAEKRKNELKTPLTSVLKNLKKLGKLK
jgi:hypothetical protein